MSDIQIDQSPDKDFEKIIQESKIKIAEESQNAQTKKRRGRPPKNSNTQSQSNARPNQSSDQSSSGITSSSAPNSNTGGTVQPTPDITNYLVEPIIALSSIPAKNTGCDGLIFSRDEATVCAQSLNQLLLAFAPTLNQMSPKTAAILGVCTTFGSIGFTKYAIYSDWYEKNKKPEKPVEVQSTNAVDQQNFGITAEDFFRR